MSNAATPPRRHPSSWRLGITPTPQNPDEARDAILDCLHRAMDIASLAFRLDTEYGRALATIEDLVTEASNLVDRWFHPTRQEGQG